MFVHYSKWGLSQLTKYQICQSQSDSISHEPSWEGMIISAFYIPATLEIFSGYHKADADVQNVVVVLYSSFINVCWYVQTATTKAQYKVPAFLSSDEFSKMLVLQGADIAAVRVSPGILMCGETGVQFGCN